MTGDIFPDYEPETPEPDDHEISGSAEGDHESADIQPENAPESEALTTAPDQTQLDEINEAFSVDEGTELHDVEPPVAETKQLDAVSPEEAIQALNETDQAFEEESAELPTDEPASFEEAHAEEPEQFTNETDQAFAETEAVAEQFSELEDQPAETPDEVLWSEANHSANTSEMPHNETDQAFGGEPQPESSEQLGVTASGDMPEWMDTTTGASEPAPGENTSNKSTDELFDDMPEQEQPQELPDEPIHPSPEFKAPPDREPVDNRYVVPHEKIGLVSFKGGYWSEEEQQQWLIDNGYIRDRSQEVKDGELTAGQAQPETAGEREPELTDSPVEGGDIADDIEDPVMADMIDKPELAVDGLSELAQKPSGESFPPPGPAADASTAQSEAASLNGALGEPELASQTVPGTTGNELVPILEGTNDTEGEQAGVFNGRLQEDVARAITEGPPYGPVDINLNEKEVGEKIADCVSETLEIIPKEHLVGIKEITVEKSDLGNTRVEMQRRADGSYRLTFLIPEGAKPSEVREEIEMFAGKRLETIMRYQYPEMHGDWVTVYQRAQETSQYEANPGLKFAELYTHYYDDPKEFPNHHPSNELCSFFESLKSRMFPAPPGSA